MWLTKLINNPDMSTIRDEKSSSNQKIYALWGGSGNEGRPEGAVAAFREAVASHGEVASVQAVA